MDAFEASRLPGSIRTHVHRTVPHPDRQTDAHIRRRARAANVQLSCRRGSSRRETQRNALCTRVERTCAWRLCRRRPAVPAASAQATAQAAEGSENRRRVLQRREATAALLISAAENERHQIWFAAYAQQLGPERSASFLIVDAKLTPVEYRERARATNGI